MRFLEQTALTIFSVLILIISIISSLLIFGWIHLDVIVEIQKNILASPQLSNIMLVINAIFIILSLVVIFFGTGGKEKESTKDGILLENESGKLLISKETLENIINSVVKDFESVQIVSSRIALDSDKNLKVYVALCVSPEVVIKDLSNNLQEKIKEAVKKSSDLDIKEVNIKIKNVLPKEEAPAQ